LYLSQGFSVSDFGLGFRVQGSEFRVSEFGFRVQGFLEEILGRGFSIGG